MVDINGKEIKPGDRLECTMSRGYLCTAVLKDGVLMVHWDYNDSTYPLDDYQKDYFIIIKSVSFAKEPSW